MFEGDHPLVNGEWNHIVTTYDSLTGYMAIYIDGTLEASTTRTPSNIINLIKDTGIRGVRGTGMTSSIDEVRIYNRALTPEEVDFIYDHEK